MDFEENNEEFEGKVTRNHFLLKIFIFYHFLPVIFYFLRNFT
jgi:hypothetical protein